MFASSNIIPLPETKRNRIEQKGRSFWWRVSNYLSLLTRKSRFRFYFAAEFLESVKFLDLSLIIIRRLVVKHVRTCPTLGGIRWYSKAIKSRGIYKAVRTLDSFEMDCVLVRYPWYREFDGSTDSQTFFLCGSFFDLVRFVEKEDLIY